MVRAFIAVPGLLGLGNLCICFCGLIDDEDGILSTKTWCWKFWKSIEICFESGRQLIL